ncbi:MAG: hypothetical protein ACD_75C01882G0001 [uncultured bacterium]|nr:MAG: hypothetical protein ACD_75C01882G0001 [uncultured bacterium]
MFGNGEDCPFLRIIQGNDQAVKQYLTGGALCKRHTRDRQDNTPVEIKGGEPGSFSEQTAPWGCHAHHSCRIMAKLNGCEQIDLQGRSEGIADNTGITAIGNIAVIDKSTSLDGQSFRTKPSGTDPQNGCRDGLTPGPDEDIILSDICSHLAPGAKPLPELDAILMIEPPG